MGSHNWLFWSPVDDEGYFCKRPNFCDCLQNLTIHQKPHLTRRVEYGSSSGENKSDLHFDFAGYIEVNPAAVPPTMYAMHGEWHHLWSVPPGKIGMRWSHTMDASLKNVDPWSAWVEKWWEMLGNACLLVCLKGQPKLSYSSNQNHHHFHGRNICLFITQPSESPALRIKSRSARSASEAYLNPWIMLRPKPEQPFKNGTKLKVRKWSTVKPGKDRIVSPWSPHSPIKNHENVRCLHTQRAQMWPLSRESFIQK